MIFAILSTLQAFGAYRQPHLKVSFRMPRHLGAFLHLSVQAGLYLEPIIVAYADATRIRTHLVSEQHRGSLARSTRKREHATWLRITQSKTLLPLGTAINRGP